MTSTLAMLAALAATLSVCADPPRDGQSSSAGGGITLIPDGGASNLDRSNLGAGALEVDRPWHALSEPSSLREMIGARRAEYRCFPHGLVYGADPFGAYALNDAYRAGRADERYLRQRSASEADTTRRKERLLTKHSLSLYEGLQQMKAGDYARAVVSLTLATRLDEGDPASRIHLAQARLARGQYESAAAALRRGLQLQPKLVYVDLELSRYFAEQDGLERYTDALRKAVQGRRYSAPEIYFLLGYFEFQRGDFDAANVAFRYAAAGLTKDDLTRDFLEVTQPGR